MIVEKSKRIIKQFVRVPNTIDVPIEDVKINILSE